MATKGARTGCSGLALMAEGGSNEPVNQGMKGGSWVSFRYSKLRCRQNRDRGIRTSRRMYFNANGSYNLV